MTAPSADERYRRWLDGDLAFSVAVFRSVATADRVPWAVGVLKAVQESCAWSCEPALFALVLETGADPKRWEQGRSRDALEGRAVIGVLGGPTSGTARAFASAPGLVLGRVSGGTS